MWEAIDQCSALIVITAWQENTICSIVCMMGCYFAIICLSYHFKYMKKKNPDFHSVYLYSQNCQLTSAEILSRRNSEQIIYLLDASLSAHLK